MKNLLIISFDRISEWIKKGAYVPRYFNPGDLFDNVHFILLNEEKPDPIAMKTMVGKANFYIHTFPTGIPHFIKTLGWNELLLKIWCRDLVRLASEIKPELIRCHWGFLNGYIAREIKRKLNIPYIVSLHINIDENVRPQMDLKRKIRDMAFQRFEKKVLKDADIVLPVYQSIIPYLNRLEIKNYKVAYNVINPDFLKVKTDYQLNNPIKLVSVGRLYEQKNPINIIRSLKNFSNVSLTFIGTGPLENSLRELVLELKLENRVFFKSDIPNSRVCSEIVNYDIFIAHTEHWELSKSILEAFLSGIPVILNHRIGKPTPELVPESREKSLCLFVENTPEGYATGIETLIKNDSLRTQMALFAKRHADNRWHPTVTENVFKETYLEILKKY